MPRCPQFGRYRGNSGHGADSAFRSRLTQAERTSRPARAARKRGGRTGAASRIYLGSVLRLVGASSLSAEPRLGVGARAARRTFDPQFPLNFRLSDKATPLWGWGLSKVNSVGSALGNPVLGDASRTLPDIRSKTFATHYCPTGQV